MVSAFLPSGPQADYGHYALAGSWGVPLSAPTQTAGAHLIHGKVPAGVAGFYLVGRLAPSKCLDLAIIRSSANAGTMVKFTAGNTNSDLPAQALACSLDAEAPADATINPASGIFSWILAQIPTNGIAVYSTNSAGNTNSETIQIVATSFPTSWLTVETGSPGLVERVTSFCIITYSPSPSDEKL